MGLKASCCQLVENHYPSKREGSELQGHSLHSFFSFLDSSARGKGVAEGGEEDATWGARKVHWTLNRGQGC